MGGVSLLLRKSRIHSLLGQSCRLQQRRGWATRSSQPSPGDVWPHTTYRQPFSSLKTTTTTTCGFTEIPKTTTTTATTFGFTGIQKLQVFVLSRGSTQILASLAIN